MHFLTSQKDHSFLGDAKMVLCGSLLLGGLIGLIEPIHCQRAIVLDVQQRQSEDITE